MHYMEHSVAKDCELGMPVSRATEACRTSIEVLSANLAHERKKGVPSNCKHGIQTCYVLSHYGSEAQTVCYAGSVSQLLNPTLMGNWQQNNWQRQQLSSPN